MNDFFYDLDNLDGSWGSVGFFNPKNLTEEQIKQLQEYLGVPADGKFGPQSTRALQEKLGVKADGKWGNVSSSAWNDAYWNEVEERNKHNSAKAAGVENPYVENVVDYVPQYEDVQEQALVQEKARQEKIAKLESQIAQVEERIARNKRALTGKSYEDVNNKLAQLEMDKIGFRFNGQSKNNDPTSFWRWNQARVDTKEANDLRKAEAKNKFGNEISKWENRQFDPNMTAMEVRQEIKNIENAIQDGKNIGADVSRLEKVRQSLLDRISGKGTTAVEDWNGKFDTFMTGVNNGVYTKEEIDNFAKEHENEMSVAQYNKLYDASIKTGKKENDKAKAILEKKAKALFQKERPSEDWEDVSETTRQKYRDRARGR